MATTVHGYEWLELGGWRFPPEAEGANAAQTKMAPVMGLDFDVGEVGRYIKGTAPSIYEQTLREATDSITRGLLGRVQGASLPGSRAGLTAILADHLGCLPEAVGLREINYGVVGVCVAGASAYEVGAALARLRGGMHAAITYLADATPASVVLDGMEIGLAKPLDVRGLTREHGFTIHGRMDREESCVLGRAIRAAWGASPAVPMDLLLAPGAQPLRVLVTKVDAQTTPLDSGWDREVRLEVVKWTEAKRPRPGDMVARAPSGEIVKASAAGRWVVHGPATEERERVERWLNESPLPCLRAHFTAAPQSSPTGHRASEPQGIPIATPVDHTATLDAMARRPPPPADDVEHARRFFAGEGERATPANQWQGARHFWERGTAR